MIISVSILLLSKFLLFASPFPHPIHISKCLIEYNQGDEALQISLHIFIDDFEEAIGRRGVENFSIAGGKESQEVERHIAQYLEDHLKLEIDGKPARWTFLGREFSADRLAVWCYLEIAGVKQIRELSVTNDILMEIYDDQKSIISILGPDNKQGYFVFHRGKRQGSVVFK